MKVNGIWWAASLGSTFVLGLAQGYKDILENITTDEVDKIQSATVSLHPIPNAGCFFVHLHDIGVLYSPPCRSGTDVEKDGRLVGIIPFRE